MHTTTRIALATGVLSLSALGCRVAAPKLDPFIDQARTSQCADKVNALYVIDHAMVFWRREGSCPDNSYAYTLYGQNPADTLCERHDSIAGLVSRCPRPETHDLFETIVAHLDSLDLGLGSAHTVERVQI
jgi:hypothetical protein